MKVQKLNNKFFSLIFCLMAIMIPSLAEAVQTSVPVPGDRRIRQYIYQPDTVFAYTGHYGYQSRIDLDPTEKILTITLGDSTRWSINPVGHRLFIKPIEFDATTNMTIITSKRIYYFELYAEEADSIDDEDIVFAARFIYGSDPADDQGSFIDLNYEEESQIPDTKKHADKLNFNYSVTGSRYISPLEVFDNGEFTYFRFKDINADLPAMFQVMPDGNEALINFRVAEGYVILEMVTSQLTLRYGSQVACIFNETMPMPKPTIDKDTENTTFFGIF